MNYCIGARVEQAIVIALHCSKHQTVIFCLVGCLCVSGEAENIYDHVIKLVKQLLLCISLKFKVMVLSLLLLLLCFKIVLKFEGQLVLRSLGTEKRRQLSWGVCFWGRQSAGSVFRIQPSPTAWYDISRKTSCDQLSVSSVQVLHSCLLWSAMVPVLVNEFACPCAIFAGVISLGLFSFRDFDSYSAYL